jgi:ribosomal protein S18 acetylase RimI-like enzyme
MDRPRQLTWTAHLTHILRTEPILPQAYTSWATTLRDKATLAALYYSAYSREIVEDRVHAPEDIERVFSGEYGTLDLAASPVAAKGATIVASVTTVVEAPWDDTPAGAFIIEVMVHPAHRRRGLATCLLSLAAKESRQRGRETVALRVISDNTKALSLYRKLGFVPWEPDGSDGG